jgi:ribosomal protein L37AE/L43A
MVRSLLECQVLRAKFSILIKRTNNTITTGENMGLQYACHFCKQKEGKVSHLGFFACKECAKIVKDHSKCSDSCSKKEASLKDSKQV